MDQFDNPNEMPPESRFREVAAILAKGYLRRRKNPPLESKFDLAKARKRAPLRPVLVNRKGGVS